MTHYAIKIKNYNKAPGIGFIQGRDGDKFVVGNKKLYFQDLRFVKPPLKCYLQKGLICAVMHDIITNAFLHIKFIDKRIGQGVFVKETHEAFLIELGITAVSRKEARVLEARTAKKGSIIDRQYSNRAFPLISTSNVPKWAYYLNAPDSGRYADSTHEFLEIQDKITKKWKLYLKPLVCILKKGQQITVPYQWQNLI